MMIIIIVFTARPSILFENQIMVLLLLLMLSISLNFNLIFTFYELSIIGLKNAFTIFLTFSIKILEININFYFKLKYYI